MRLCRHIVAASSIANDSAIIITAMSMVIAVAAVVGAVIVFSGISRIRMIIYHDHQHPHQQRQH